MRERLVGLTAVALGTSLPELATSAIAAGWGHSDIAVGNVVGSNIYNGVACLGAAAMAGTVAIPIAVVGTDLAALFIMTGLAAVYIRTSRIMSRFEGAVAITLYTVFVILTVAMAWA